MSLWYHGYVEQRVVGGRVHVRVHQDGGVLEGDGLAAAAALVRALLRVVHLQQQSGVAILSFLLNQPYCFTFLKYDNHHTCVVIEKVWWLVGH